MASTANPMILAGSAVLAVGLGYLALQGLSSGGGSDIRNKESDALVVVTDIDEEHSDEHITVEEVTRIFDRLFREMQAIFGQLLQQIQAIQMAGQNIPELQLRAMLRGEMERALAVKQKMILEEFEMDYDCLEEATWEFLEKEEDYPGLKTAVNRFQKFWENVSNEDHMGWRPGKSVDHPGPAPETLTEDRLVEVSQVYFDALTNQMKELVAQFKAEGKDMKSPVVQHHLNLEFSERGQTAGEDALKAEGVTMAQFEHSVKAHSDNPSVGRQLQMMQMKQQQELFSIGSS
ncbi:hypothetical protein ACA910_011338 [Epithemia clementina (nom. ined.)]